MFGNVVRVLIASILGLALSGCAQPNVSDEKLSLPPDAPALRQVQTRYFDTEDEAELLSASAALLQDLGFLLDETNSELGLIVASKVRNSTIEAEYLMGQLFEIK